MKVTQGGMFSGGIGYLYKNINKEESLKSIINTGIIEVKKEYELRLNGFKVEKLDLPSSSIVVVKFHENKVEYFY